MRSDATNAAPPRAGSIRRLGTQPSLNGLRVAALLLVLVYHTFPDMFGGGFLGVDLEGIDPAPPGPLLYAALVAPETQHIRDVREAQAARADWAAAAEWGDASHVWEHLSTKTNFVRAAEQIDWPALLPSGATVLDLGCGAGWLSAMLSTQPRVERVIAWDSSPALLSVVPDMVTLVGGHAAKIDRVCGDFVPLLLDDDAVDVVVMSSAFHHAERPEALLAELARVLTPNGAVVLLNETPWHPMAILGFATRMYGAAMVGLAGPITQRAGHLGSRHVLYDDTLGDRAYSPRAWRQMLCGAGFAVEVRDTGLMSYPDSYRRPARFERPLVHFILRPRSAVAGPGATGRT